MVCKESCVRRRCTGLAAGVMAFKTLTRRHGFKVLSTAACPVGECAAAACPVGECAAAACPVGECAAAACPCSFIDDEDLCTLLSRFGKVVSPVKMLPTGCKDPELKHIYSYRRQAFMILNNRDEDINVIFKTKCDGEEYTIYATSGSLKCFGCGQEGLGTVPKNSPETVPNCPEEQAAGEQETGTVTENIQEREQGENKQDSGEDNTQTVDQEENKQQGTTTESQEGWKDTEPEVNHMESENEQSQCNTENNTQLANSQNTEECEGTDMTIDDSGFTPVRQWWDHGKVLIQQLCREYTVNITRDITKSLKDLEIGIVELQALAESTGDRRHVEDLKVK
ncbi:hypothetical protein QTP70_035054 [Hemibagrus guttatus]|uniref:Uncharacterized protein n=1 Tax=Hemibagrus guttatus TaxID=175788 RepID=A0AAE0R7Q0_9TELE|nr:hypothetical protein QTP70_035054 [Hemibagrus guttatus]